MKLAHDMGATLTRAPAFPTPPLVDSSAGRLAVPAADLRTQVASLQPALSEVMANVIASGCYVLGPHVEAFEDAFARFVGIRHCVAVNSGTSALHLALRALGIGPGHEVIVPAMTFVATAWAVSYCGATPIFADIDPNTFTLVPAEVERRLTPRTRAIVPVHLYGQPADLWPLMDVACAFDLPIIEDAAQAHGAIYQSMGAGSLGSCGCFSFYPGKNLGACGEGGAVVTDDGGLADHLRSLRDHGQSRRYHHDEIGFNYRMDALQGAILRLKLDHLVSWNERRRELATRYAEAFADLPLELPTEVPGREHIYHQYVIQHDRRDELQRALAERGVQAGLHYPIPLHLQPAYASLGGKPGDHPIAERLARRCLSLPIYPEMTDAQHEHVVACVREFFAAQPWN